MYDFYMNGMLSYEDDINILNSHRNYDNNTEKKICFTYDYSDSRLQTLRLEYIISLCLSQYA
mgnify:CR=1 FL=1